MAIKSGETDGMKLDSTQLLEPWLMETLNSKPNTKGSILLFIMEFSMDILFQGSGSWIVNLELLEFKKLSILLSNSQIKLQY